jgi:3-hydroxybutyryl-CoA dehydratase
MRFKALLVANEDARAMRWFMTRPGGGENTDTAIGFTAIRYEKPCQSFGLQYIQTLIQLDDADTPLVHIIQRIPAGQILMDLCIKAVFAYKTTATIMDIDRFRPDVEDSKKLGYT